MKLDRVTNKNTCNETKQLTEGNLKSYCFPTLLVKKKYFRSGGVFSDLKQQINIVI